MSQFTDFAKRFHAVKEGVQEIALQDLEKANSAYVSGNAVLQEAIDSLADAKKLRSKSTGTVADLTALNTYIARLETLVDLQQEKTAALGKMVEEKRASVKEAYIEQEKWSQIVDRYARKKQHANLLGSQKEADESAVIRHGRSI